VHIELHDLPARALPVFVTSTETVSESFNAMEAADVFRLP
jgi:hypothetical protein